MAQNPVWDLTWEDKGGKRCRKVHLGRAQILGCETKWRELLEGVRLQGIRTLARAEGFVRLEGPGRALEPRLGLKHVLWGILGRAPQCQSSHGLWRSEWGPIPHGLLSVITPQQAGLALANAKVSSIALQHQPGSIPRTGSLQVTDSLCGDPQV